MTSPPDTPEQLDFLLQLAWGADDDPPMLFKWHPTKLAAFVAQSHPGSVQALLPDATRPPVPAGLTLPVGAALTPESFAAAVMDYLRRPNAAARVRTVCLPCTSVGASLHPSRSRLRPSTTTNGSSASPGLLLPVLMFTVLEVPLDLLPGPPLRR